MILDTNALSAWLGGERPLQRHLETAQRISLSPIALGEFRLVSWDPVIGQATSNGSA